ncbi:MAG: TetR/AcrR family transcriptional regulator [Acidimicrobiales bacterium]|nr:TetR/AcrR family transcriptional regulator [Acidimicrobiales bacterium]HCA39376.1 hypothetical protein [Phycisphaerales bacterium]|tara:strand:+ start:326 stop:1444 length:1119 start_codon:yes stop_codon:yes gene_type:complete
MTSALQAVAANGPSSVSGRSIARTAQVHHAQVQQMFGSVDDLVTFAVLEERDRFIQETLGNSSDLPDPLAAADYPEFWRAIAQVLLDPGPVDLSVLADGGPVELIRGRLTAIGPDRDPLFETAIAATWAAIPLGALVFADPLCRGLGISDEDWGACWTRLGDRVRSLADVAALPLFPTRVEPTSSVDETLPGGRGRERLLHTAETLLETRLETAVTGRELAAAAGVNYGLVNHYFGTKTAVFDEALVHLHQRFLRDVLDVEDAMAHGVFDVFSRHRAFLRAWASRLLGDRPPPEFELRGMERLMEEMLAARGIGLRDRAAHLHTAGDALASIALQLGWTILRPLPSAVDPRGMAEIATHLQAINAWLVHGSE